MPGYRYRGDQPDKSLHKQSQTPGFDTLACGTYAGYRRHQTRGSNICDPCRAAMSAYFRALRPPAPKKTFNPDACGTWRGWQRHKYHDIPPCDACTEAAKEYQRQYRAKRKAMAG